MKRFLVLGAVGAAVWLPLSLRSSDTETGTTNQASSSEAANSVEVNFTSSELEHWTLHDNKAKDFSATIVPNAEGDKPALQLQYTVQADPTAHPAEIPDSVAISSTDFASRLTFSGDKPVFCAVRIKGSQQRTVRAYLCDSTQQNFFTGQALITTDWQTIEIPVSQGFWNRWYPPDNSGSKVHDQPIWPLQDIRIDVLFAQSVPQFAPAGGASINVPEQILIQSIRFHQ